MVGAINTGITHLLSQGARLLMEGFVDEVRETAELVELREREAAVLDSVVADRQPSVIDETGTIRRAHDSAGGLAMLAQLSSRSCIRWAAPTPRARRSTSSSVQSGPPATRFGVASSPCRWPSR